MTECQEEQTTKHFLGPWYGFGPVKNDESVLFAVFTTTKTNGSRLTGASFNNNHLKSSNQSLARRAYVTLPIFYQTIVRPVGSPLRGIAFANASEIRALVADVKLGAGQTSTVRALCLIDRVDKDDCDGHAAAGYSESHEALNISKEQLGKIRGKIRLDLANAFSEISEVVSCRWPGKVSVLANRVLSIVRVALHHAMP